MLERLNGDEKGDAIVSVRGYEPIWTVFTPSYELKDVYFKEGKASMAKREAVLFDKNEYVFDITNKNGGNENERLLTAIEEEENRDNAVEIERQKKLDDLDGKWLSIEKNIQLKLQEFANMLNPDDKQAVLNADLDSIVALLFMIEENYNNKPHKARKIREVAEYINGELPKLLELQNQANKCYSMADIIVALIVFGIIFIAVTMGQWVIAVILGLVAVGMFIPTPDGIFYTCVYENIRFLFSKKKYTKGAKNAKESVDALVDLKEIKDSGLIAYKGGMFGRVIKIGQKNFGIEDVVQQNIDINYFANALKLLDQNQSADIVKIDRPVNLDGFSSDLFARLSAAKDSDEEKGIKIIKENILTERIDRIDRLNNIRKQYLSDYYIVVYGRNELDLESTAVNVASEIAKCGLGTQLLGLTYNSIKKLCLDGKYSSIRL